MILFYRLSWRKVEKTRAIHALGESNSLLLIVDLQAGLLPVIDAAGRPWLKRRGWAGSLRCWGARYG